MLHSKLQDLPNRFFPAVDIDISHPSFRPWYSALPAVYFDGSTAKAPSASFNWNDTPANGPPITSAKPHLIPNGGDWLASMDLHENFQLDIAAATYDDPNTPYVNGTSNRTANAAIYTRLATANWTFNLTSPVLPQPNAKPIPLPLGANPVFSVAVNPPNGANAWTPVTDGSRPNVLRAAPNALAKEEDFTP
jgi:hypothetical protein